MSLALLQNECDKTVFLHSVLIIDMAVGAPSAEQVFVYRSYPVAKVIASVETDKRELVQSESQLVASVCVQLQPNIAADAGAQIKLQLTFKLDTQFGRAFFFDDKNNVRKFEMIASTQKKCQMFDISLKYKLEDIFKPLELELHYVNLNAVPHSEGKILYLIESFVFC